MSINTAKEFLARIATESGTAEKAKGLSGSALVGLARQMGYVFSEADLQQAASGASDPNELSDDDLNRVSGGIGSAFSRYGR